MWGTLSGRWGTLAVDASCDTCLPCMGTRDVRCGALEYEPGARECSKEGTEQAGRSAARSIEQSGGADLEVLRSLQALRDDG